MQIRYRQEMSAVEHLEPLRLLLEKDLDGSVLRVLTDDLSTLDSNVQSAVAFLISARLRETGDVQLLKKLYFENAANVRQGVLNGLWEPGAQSAMRATVLELVLDGLSSSWSAVRAESCRTLQNICDYGVDAASALEALGRLLKDEDGLVRMAAACAIGVLARKRLDLSPHIPPLAENLRHADRCVREYSADALWRISSRHDIGEAVENLVWLMSQSDADLKRARRWAARALLHHSRKSKSNAAKARRLTDAVSSVEQSIELDDLRKKVDAGG